MYQPSLALDAEHGSPVYLQEQGYSSTWPRTHTTFPPTPRAREQEQASERAKQRCCTVPGSTPTSVSLHSTAHLRVFDGCWSCERANHATDRVTLRTSNPNLTPTPRIHNINQQNQRGSCTVRVGVRLSSATACSSIAAAAAQPGMEAGLMRIGCVFGEYVVSN